MTLDQVVEKYGACALCTKLRDGGPVLYEGGPSDICFVAEALGEEEVKLKRPLIGRSGQLFRKIVGVTPLDITKVFLMNIVSCRPKANKINDTMISNCKPVWKSLIEACAPKVIVAMGSIAGKNLCPDVVSRGILESRGKVGRYNGIPVVITLHPSYVMRQEGMVKDGMLSSKALGVLKRAVLSDFRLAKQIAEGGIVNGTKVPGVGAR